MEELDRERLLSGYLAAVKVCQVRYGGRTELATESDPRVAALCDCLEETLVHGLRMRVPNRGIGAIRQVTDLVSSGLNLHLTLGNNESGKPVLWWYVRELLTRHEYDRFLLLRNVSSDEGRGRAWLRSLLNEHSLERYIHIMLSDQSFLELWYEPWALLRDQERAAMLPNLAAGLDSILFAINIDNESLNAASHTAQGKEIHESQNKLTEPEPQVAQLAENASSIDSPVPSKKYEARRKRRKIPSQLVSFDEDVLTTSTQSPPLSPDAAGYFSAPSTSVNSPATTPASSTRFDTEQELAKATLQELKDPPEPMVNVGSTPVPPKTLNLAEREEEASYSQVLEELLASQSLGDESVDIAPGSRSHARGDQESESLKSGLSNASVESFHSSEGEPCIGAPTLLPIESNTGGLIPMSPDGEVLYDDGQEDANSLKSSSQEEFDLSECLSPSMGDCEERDRNSSLISAEGLLSLAATSTTVTSSTFSSHSFDELRTAVLEVSRARDACEERRAAIAQALSAEMEASSTLRAQLAHEQTQNKDSVDRLTAKVNTLTRENELLRHQLKKYIGAVQMLRRDSDGEGVESLLSSLPSHKPPDIRDYHYEAAAYEGKLIQVAEMHGELMEFSERLQRLLRFRESQVYHLKEELVELRGPLPAAENEEDFDDTVSATSDLDAFATPRTLINIWIPTAFLAGPSSDTHHVYQIYVRIKDDEWNVYRRFAQFYLLHKQFRRKDPVIRTFDFPQKKTFGYKDISVVEDRRLKLQQYLRQLVNFLVSSNHSLSSQPSKSSLTSLLPFLLDPALPKERSASKSQTKRRFLSRLSNRQESPPTQSSPQYNGL